MRSGGESGRGQLSPTLALNVQPLCPERTQLCVDAKGKTRGNTFAHVPPTCRLSTLPEYVISGHGSCQLGAWLLLMRTGPASRLAPCH